MVFDVASERSSIWNKPNQDCAAVFAVENEVDFGHLFFGAIPGIEGELRRDARFNDSGTTFCGVGVEKRDEDEFEFTVANLGDSRAFLVLSNGEKPILLSLSEDFGFVKRFRDKLKESGADFGYDNHEMIRVKSKGGFGVNMSGALGDFDIDGLLNNPDVFKYNSADFKEIDTEVDYKKSKKDLRGFKPEGVLVVSDAFTKAGSLGWVPSDVEEVYSLKIDDEGKRVFVLDNAKNKCDCDIEEINAGNFVSYIKEAVGKQDDNSAAFIDLKEMRQGQKLLAAVADGHGKNGHEASKRVVRVLERYQGVDLRGCAGAMTVKEIEVEERASPEVKGFWSNIKDKFCKCFGRQKHRDDRPSAEFVVTGSGNIQGRRITTYEV